jgi:uncharacterized repeat protein (TIGR01451 family)
MAAALLPQLASGHRQPFGGRLENFDRRERIASAPPGRAQSLARLQRALPEARVEFDEVTGAAKFVRAHDGFLSGANGVGRAVPAAAHAGLAANEPHRATKAFLNEHRALFGHGAEALEAARVSRDYITTHNGARAVVWQQELDGLPIFEAVLSSHTTRNGELVSMASQFVADPAGASGADAAKRAALAAAPPITLEQAVVRAAAEVNETLVEADVRRLGELAGPDRWQRVSARALSGTTHARLVWLPVSAGRMRLCWEVILTSAARGEMFRVLIDAQAGIAWLRHSLTAYISPASYRVFTNDSPTPFSPGYLAPSTNQPLLAARALVIANALNTNASPNGWINDGDNETRGNNVDAHTDKNADDQPDLPRPQGSPFRVFDFPLDLAQPPSSYSAAATVQLFYWCNWMHDRLYELGFTEAAGNFQVDNFGRGGVGNDPVQADAQDGESLNNANMATPPEGLSPRMQMFLFTGPEPDRDGDFDAEVILHEYTHGLSNRRVGGGVGIFQLQSAGMGEGWSDFYALALLSEPGDDVDGVYAAAAYVSFQLEGLRENYYFGIRRYPYSTDLTKNPLTFKDIDPGQISPHTGVPLSPINQPFSPFFADEVHSQGEVWCVTLWEARANLIRKHGFAAGNQLILQLVTDGMGLSPANPNFLQARDAILLADQVNNGGANQRELWSAFARRGMGYSATSPASSTTAGVRESYDLPDDLRVLPLADFLPSGSVGGPFFPSVMALALTNVGSNVVVWSASRTAGWLNVTSDSGTIPTGGSASVTLRLDNSAGSLPAGRHSATIQFSNATTQVTQSRLATLVAAGSDPLTEQFDSTPSDLDFVSFTFTPDGSPGFYSVCRAPAAVFPTDPAGGTNAGVSTFGFARVTLTNGESVSLYGHATNSFFINGNGTITFDGSDTSITESLPIHFSQRRISGLFDDYYLQSTNVTWRLLSNRVAVTFLNAPNFFGFSTTNSFQMEMFFDGRIRLTYLAVGSTGGLVGLSRGGGMPEDFIESNFSAYPLCSLAPLALFLPASFSEGAGVVAGGGSVRLAAPSAANRIVALSSSDPSELAVPPSLTVLAGETNASFDVLVIDDAILDGNQNVIVSAASSGHLSTRTRVQVLDNELASLSLSLPAAATEGAGPLTGVVSMSAVPTVGIAVTLASGDTNELATPMVAVIPAGATSVVFTASVIDDHRIDGPQSVTVTAHVGNWSDGIASVLIADNEPTNLTLVLPPRTREGRGVLTNAGTIQFGGTVVSNVVVTLASSDTTELTVPGTVTVLEGTSSARFDVTAMDDADVDGTQSATVTASAPGFAGAMTSIAVFDDESPLPPAYPSPPHLASNVTATADLAWGGGEFTELLVNGDFETGDFTGWVRAANLYGNFEINTPTHEPTSPDGPLPPFEGNFNALGEVSGPGIISMHQDVTLPAGGQQVKLNWADRVRNFASVFATNQEYRVEIRDTNNLVLAVAHRTTPGDPPLDDWRTWSYDLTPFTGQTVRVAFVIDPGLFYLGAHVDAVSVAVSTPGSTTFDVYFGTNATPGAAELLGTTTNSNWSLPTLAPATTYYWQIVARTLGQLAGPVWQFTTRGVERFEWSLVASPQSMDEPFSVTLTAKDSIGATVTNFTGPISLAGLGGTALGSIFTDDFEDGNFDGWTAGGGEFVRQVTEEQSADGSRSCTLIGGANQHYGGLEHDLPNVRPDWMRFAVRGSRTDASGGYVVVGTSTNRGDRAAFFFMESGGSMGLYEDAGFRHQVPYTANRWYQIGLAFSWTNRTVDFYVDDVLVERDIPFRGASVTRLSKVWLYNYDYTQSWWDDIQFVTNGVAVNVALSPTNSGTFSDGAWTGDITVHEPALGLLLQAADGQGHFGTAGPIDVGVSNDVAVMVQASVGPASILTPISFGVSVANAGPSGASGVWLTNTLPADATLVSFVASQGACNASGAEIVCNLGTIAGGTNARLSVLVMPERFGTFTNVATVARAEADALEANNTALAVTTVAPPLLGIADATVTEGNSGRSEARFALTLSESNRLPVSVSFMGSNGTAAAGTDWIAANGLVVFPPGVTRQDVVVQIVGDTNAEPDEYFTLYLNNPVNASLTRRAATGIIVNDDATAIATMPFTENWESGGFRPYWRVTGTGPFRAQVSGTNEPHGGAFHLVMDSQSFSNARNEVTFSIDMQGWTNVALRFWAVEFYEFPDGPPPVPFLGGADFDGVAISIDGVRWYEVQGLRFLFSAYSEFVVDLDTAVRANGLAYTSGFRVRFNEYGLYPLDFGGMGIDDISITGNRAAILPAEATLLAENCGTPNGAADPGELVTVSFGLTNAGLAAATQIIATLLPDGGVVDPSGPQNYGALGSGGATVARPFTFKASGVCDGSLRATLRLRDGATDFGVASFELPLGARTTNVSMSVNTNVILIPSNGIAAPYPSSNMIAGATGVIQRVAVTLHGLTHDFPDHLDVLLVGPLGQNCLLLSDSGGSNPVNNLTITFDSTASGRVADEAPLVSGTYNPINFGGADVFSPPAPSSGYGTNLGVFHGLAANGAWRLFVIDDTAGFAGTIAGGWTLAVETVDVSCCADGPVADLTTRMTDSPDPANLEGNVTYTLFVTNRGPLTASAVMVTNPVPSDSRFVSVSSTAGSCTNEAGLVWCSLGPLASNASASVTIVLQALQAGVLTNSATVMAAELDNNLSNNTARATTAVFRPTLFVSSVSAIEGNTTNVVVTLTPRLSFALSRPASFDFATTVSGATPGADFMATNGQIVFLPGETSNTLSLVIFPDTLDETNELVSVSVFNPVNLSLNLGQSAVTIIDDDDPPSLAIDDVTITEGNSGTSPAVFPVRLSAAGGLRVQANYFTASGTASSPADFVGTNGVIVLLPGQTNSAIRVAVRGETLNELDESFVVNLATPTNCTLADSQGVGSILNDDFLPNIVLSSAAIVAENCLPANQALDPGETVSVSFTLRNLATGVAGASNATATLVAGGGVAAPDGPRSYGTLAPGGQATRTFMFIADGPCGNIVTPRLELVSENASLMAVTTNFQIGRIKTSFTQSFDTVTPPGLPAGWTAAGSGVVAWRTSTSSADTPPNAAFAGDPSNASTNLLTSPAIAIATSIAQLSFRHYYNTESGFDGGTLEYSADGVVYQDILAAGGRFLAGGYNGDIDLGTPAWTGNSGVFTNTIVSLPATAAGRNIRLRWRMTSDSVVSDLGWFVDTIRITDGFDCCGAVPPRIGRISFDAGTVRIEWFAIPGENYRVQYKPTIDAAAWIDLPGDVTAGGVTAFTTDAPGPVGQRFYRVLLLP